MLNIIKMDLYKMLKSKSFYLLNIILIFITLTVGIVIKINISKNYQDAKESNITWSDKDSLSTGDPSLTEEQYNKMQEKTINELDIKEFMTMQYSQGITLTLMAIFLALIICSELDTGFIKNIVPLKNSRTSLLLSKTILSIVFILIQAAIGLGISIISTILLSGKINVLKPKELLVFLALQILLSIAFSSLIIMISYLTKSKSAAIAAGILLSLNVHGLFLNLLDKIINISKINVSQLSIVNNSRMYLFEQADYKRIILISLAYFILYNIISTIRVRKMEIN